MDEYFFHKNCYTPRTFPRFKNSYLNDRQSGFRKLFSTTTAVLDVSEIILEEMNKNKFVGAAGPNLEFMGRVLMFRKRARQCPMNVSQMRLHHSWGGGWGCCKLENQLLCPQWSGSGKKTAKKGTNIQSEDTSTWCQ